MTFFRTTLKITPFLFFFFAITPHLHAQFTDFSLGVSPQYPKANAVMAGNLSSFSFDINRSRVSWRLDGVIQKSGVGEKTFEFNAPEYGKRRTVSATVEPPGGGQLIKSATINPQEVHILWYAHSYIPPLYRGRALPTSRSAIIVTAFPELLNSSGTRLSLESLVYDWQQDGVALGSVSGYGKRSIVLGSEVVPPGETTISVLVSSLNGETRGRETISIRTEEPRVLLYEKHPLQGVRHERAFGNTFSLQSPGIVLRAEPYFFSLDDVAKNNVRFRWLLNNSQISEGKNELAFEKISGVSGASKITVDFQNLKKVLQKARAMLTINFGE